MKWSAGCGLWRGWRTICGSPRNGGGPCQLIIGSHPYSWSSHHLAFTKTIPSTAKLCKRKGDFASLDCAVTENLQLID
jgi:hypothetical protein